VEEENQWNRLTQVHLENDQQNGCGGGGGGGAGGTGGTGGGVGELVKTLVQI